MAESSVTLEFLAQLAQRTLDEMRAMRKEVADVRTLSLQTHDFSRRLDRRMDGFDRRMADLKDDLEVMLKAELMGSMTHMETKLDHYLQPIRDRLLGLDRLEGRVSALERKAP